MTDVSVALAVSAELGECPIWSERGQRLPWVDTRGGTVNRFDPSSGENVAMTVPAPVGCVAENDALTAGSGRLYRFDPHGRRLCVTTARLGLDLAALVAAPLSAALLTLPYLRATGAGDHA